MPSYIFRAANLEPIHDNFIQINSLLTTVPEAGNLNLYQPTDDFIYRTEQMSETSTEVEFCEDIINIYLN